MSLYIQLLREMNRNENRISVLFWLFIWLQRVAYVTPTSLVPAYAVSIFQNIIRMDAMIPKRIKIKAAQWWRTDSSYGIDSG